LLKEKNKDFGLIKKLSIDKLVLNLLQIDFFRFALDGGKEIYKSELQKKLVEELKPIKIYSKIAFILIPILNFVLKSNEQDRDDYEYYTKDFFIFCEYCNKASLTFFVSDAFIYIVSKNNNTINTPEGTKEIPLEQYISITGLVYYKQHWSEPIRPGSTFYGITS